VLFRREFLLDVGRESYCDTLFLVRSPFRFVILTSPYGHVASSELSVANLDLLIWRVALVRRHSKSPM
jgi:hypothetical protein